MGQKRWSHNSYWNVFSKWLSRKAFTSFYSNEQCLRVTFPHNTVCVSCKILFCSVLKCNRCKFIPWCRVNNFLNVSVPTGFMVNFTHSCEKSLDFSRSHHRSSSFDINQQRKITHENSWGFLISPIPFMTYG